MEYQICSKKGRKGMPGRSKEAEKKEILLYKKIICEFANCIRVSRLSIKTFDTSLGTQIIISQEYKKEINVKCVLSDILRKIVTTFK